jgi:hypothetical protein
MGSWVTAAQIEEQFEAEWVLLGDPETNDALEVQRGKVLWHSKDRDEVYRKCEPNSQIPVNDGQEHTTSRTKHSTVASVTNASWPVNSPFAIRRLSNLREL